MRKGLVCSVALASILLLAAAICAPARAVDYTLGLAVGTTATYSPSYTMGTNVTSGDLEVTWRNDTALSVVFTSHYGSMYQEFGYATWDVRYGPGSNASLAMISLYVVAANLNVNDPIVMSGIYHTWTINSSTTWFVANAFRIVNVHQQGQYLFAYWDRQMGLMVKLSWNVGLITPDWFNLTLTATSAWTGATTPAIPGYPVEAIGIALAIGLVTGALFHRKHPKPVSPP